jgi:hypothetical protein
LLILPAIATVCAVEIVRRGFGAPVLYGIRQWLAARPGDPADQELDYLA